MVVAPVSKTGGPRFESWLARLKSPRSDLRKPIAGLCLNRPTCGCGGIGRRAGFRCRWPWPWGFESLHPHWRGFSQKWNVEVEVRARARAPDSRPPAAIQSRGRSEPDAAGGIRTHTPSRAMAFETIESAVPPPPLHARVYGLGGRPPEDAGPGPPLRTSPSRPPVRSSPCSRPR